MGFKCSSQCIVCWFMCLLFPAGICYFCPDERHHGDINAQEEAAKFSIDDLLKVYANMTASHQPADFCGALHGTYRADPTPTCTIDLSNSDTFLKYVTGIDTAEQLCTKVKGNFDNGDCVLNVASFGLGSLDVKQAACVSLGGQWSNNNCALVG